MTNEIIFALVLSLSYWRELRAVQCASEPAAANSPSIPAASRVRGHGRPPLRARPKIELSDFSSLCFTGVCEDHEDHKSWTETARREHGRSGLRYASDCTDEEWAVVRPLLRRTSSVLRPRKHKARTLCMHSVSALEFGATDATLLARWLRDAAVELSIPTATAREVVSADGRRSARQHRGARHAGRRR